MFPILVTVNNREQLTAVHNALEALNGGAPAETAKPAKAAKVAKETAAPAAAAPAAAAPAATGPSPAAQAFLQGKIAGPLQELCLKDYPKAEAILKEYGVERASLVPETKLEEFLTKIQRALNPGIEEQERLAAVDKKTSLF